MAKHVLQYDNMEEGHKVLCIRGKRGEKREKGKEEKEIREKGEDRGGPLVLLQLVSLLAIRPHEDRDLQNVDFGDL